MSHRTPVALITGASLGLGRALATELVWSGWRVVADARDGARLAAAVRGMSVPSAVTAIAGDVSDPAHRRRLAEACDRAGGLDLLVNNASTLGPSPPPRLAGYPLDEFERVLRVNVVAPLALLQLVLPLLERRAGRVVDVSSDAAVEGYEGWGGYGAAKAALDLISAVAAVEHPRLRVYAFDPGEMATDMLRQAYPGQDVSDRPLAESVVPALMRLVKGGLPSGRYRAADLRLPVPA